MAILHSDGQTLMVDLCKALGVDPDYAGRIILDIVADAPIRAYVEMYASDKILNLDWGLIFPAQVEVLDKPKPWYAFWTKKDS